MPFKLGHMSFQIPLVHLEVCMPCKLGQMNEVLNITICKHFKLGHLSFQIPWVDSPILSEERLITYKAVV